MDGSVRNIKVGEFDLQPDISYALIIDLITDSQESDVSITIPEGYTLDQIGEVVTENFNITQEEWNMAVGQYSSVLNLSFFLNQTKPFDVDFEGYLFPDTYRFFPNATAEDIVFRMTEEMSAKLGEAYKLTGSVWVDPEFDVHDVLTLASIIEREVADPSEMAMVADIFLKRLDVGIPLQSDATINYIIGGDDPTPSLADLEVDSLYNTYKYAGLPPGPISNPGLNAIEAVLNPTPNDYYYFLTTDEGEVIYSQTFDEHIRNKAIYLINP